MGCIPHGTRPAPCVAYCVWESVSIHACDWQIGGDGLDAVGRVAICSGGDWNPLARQIFVVGVEPLGFVCGIAVIVGISVVVQLSFWAGEAG